MLRYSLFTTLIIFSFSCSVQTVEWVYMTPGSGNEVIDRDYEVCDKEPYRIHVSYVEDAMSYLIFHVQIESFVNDTTLIESSDFRWAENNPENRKWTKLTDKDELISLLQDEKESIKKAKKSSTLANAIVAGIEALAIATTPGGGVAALVYAAESGAYIAEDRNAFNVASLSIDDEIKYIEDWVLAEIHLPPYEAVNFDILIDRSLYSESIYIRSLLGNETCEFRFNSEIIKERI